MDRPATTTATATQLPTIDNGRIRVSLFEAYATSPVAGQTRGEVDRLNETTAPITAPS
jgi:hypothetical protein